MAAVELAPEVLTKIGSIKITNSIAATALTDAVLFFFVFFVYKNIKIIPGKVQLVTEAGVGYFYSLTEEIAGKFTTPIFPWFASFFIFIFVTNILGLLPGFGSIGFYFMHNGAKIFTPLLRAGTSDFNTTFGLAVLSLILTHYLAIRYNGIADYLKRYFSLNPIFLFVGFLEIISEITKVISLSFRLFGNIYAGEVVMHTVSSIAAFIAPIPFLLLETIVAFVQALVFSMLTMVFMTILISPHSEGGEH